MTSAVPQFLHLFQSKYPSSISRQNLQGRVLVLPNLGLFLLRQCLLPLTPILVVHTTLLGVLLYVQTENVLHLVAEWASSFTGSTP
jgi:hypothetical protein